MNECRQNFVGIEEQDLNLVREHLIREIGKSESYKDEVENIIKNLREGDRNELINCESSLFKTPPLSLISFDVDAIQDYVFATSKPLEIKGASEIVKALTDENSNKSIYEIIKVKGLNSRSVIFAEGGSGLILTPKSESKEISREIEERFREHSINWTVTCEIMDIYPMEILFGRTDEKICENNSYFDTSNTTHFGTLTKILLDKLRRKKNEKMIYYTFNDNERISPYFKRCSSCGIYPVSLYDEIYKDEADRYICEICMKKRCVGRKINSNTNENLKEAETTDDIVGENIWKNSKLAKRDDLAIIYADGHNLGSILKNGTLADFREIPRFLAKNINKSLEEIINELKLKNRYLAPIIGGDDLVLFLPAKKVLEVLEKLFEKLNSINKEKISLKDLTFDIGVLIADSHLPVKYLFKYAKTLMKNAKSYAYKKLERESKLDWTIDFHTIKGGSPLNLNINALREKTLNLDLPGNNKYYLTGKPYFWKDFENLLRYSKDLKNIPKSQIHILLNYLIDEPKVAKLNVGYQIIKSDEFKTFFRDKLKQNNPDEWINFFLEKDENNDWKTKFLDIIELYKLGVE
jgi:hypothetical protein